MGFFGLSDYGYDGPEVIGIFLELTWKRLMLGAPRGACILGREYIVLTVKTPFWNETVQTMMTQSMVTTMTPQIDQKCLVTATSHFLFKFKSHVPLIGFLRRDI